MTRSLDIFFVSLRRDCSLWNITGIVCGLKGKGGLFALLYGMCVVDLLLVLFFNLIPMIKIKGFLAFCCALALSTTAFASFIDVDSTDENYDAILYVQENGIVGGYSDGSFQPYGLINRAELLKILVIAREGADISDEQAGNCFSDVSSSAWYSKYVCYAKTQGYIDGYPDNTFRPGNYITFVEAAKMTTVTLGYLVYPDSEVWYRPHVYALEERGAIPTSIFWFTVEMLRGEIAEIIYRLDAQISDLPTMTYDCLNGESTCAVGDGGWEDDWSGDGGGGWSTNSTFSYYDVMVGDVIAGWTLSSMNAVTDLIGYGPSNVVFHFDGSATLTGRYDYSSTDSDGLWQDFLCFDSLDSKSLYYMPWMMESDSAPEWSWFCFSNQKEAKGMFGITDTLSESGEATIVVEDLSLVYYPSEMNSAATLMNVLVPQ